MEFNNALHQDIAHLESYDLTLEVCLFTLPIIQFADKGSHMSGKRHRKLN